jgi:hypothetical protein
MTVPKFPLAPLSGIFNACNVNLCRKICHLRLELNLSGEKMHDSEVLVHPQSHILHKLFIRQRYLVSNVWVRLSRFLSMLTPLR